MADSAKLQVPKCPSCGGAVRYDAEKGSLACSWCGHTYETAGLEVHEIDPELHGYLCPECAAQLMADDFIAAGTCPYCGNNEVAPHRFEGAFEPDYIIPFSVTKSRAIEIYEESLRQRKFLPDDFIGESRIISVQGVYVPFWLKDGVVDFAYNYELHYHKYGHRNGRSSTTNYIAKLRRGGTYTYTRVPADGSERMPDDLMDSVEPYQYDALLPFSTEYLPGFIAERYTVSPDEVDSRVDGRVKVSACNAAGETLKSCLEADANYDFWKFMLEGSSAGVDRTGSAQALLPVWVLVVSYHGEKYLVGVNGQTGKVAVNLPIEKKKENREVAKQTIVEAAGIFLGVPAFLLLVIFIIAFATYGSIDPVLESLSHITEIGFGSWEFWLFVIVFLFWAALVAIYPYLRYKKAKEEVHASMQNVAEAVDADSFDNGGLKITLEGTW